MSQSLAKEFYVDDIRVNCIGSGLLRASLTEGAVEPVTGLARTGHPEDIAYAALYLASDEAGWGTGQVLNIDGGVDVGTGLCGNSSGEAIIGFRISPVLARIIPPDTWHREEREIAEILEVSLCDLTHADAHGEVAEQFSTWPEPRLTPFYQVGPYRLWGVTYRILKPLPPQMSNR